MKLYPVIAIIDLSGDCLAEVTCIEERDAAAFIGEVRAELAAAIGVRPEVAAAMISMDVGDTIGLPMPGCFELSEATRRAFAREVAGLIKHYFQPAASDVSRAA